MGQITDLIHHKFQSAYLKPEEWMGTCREDFKFCWMKQASKKVLSQNLKDMGEKVPVGRAGQTQGDPVKGSQSVNSAFLILRIDLAKGY